MENYVLADEAFRLGSFPQEDRLCHVTLRKSSIQIIEFDQFSQRIKS